MYFRPSLILLLAVLPILALAAPGSEDQKWAEFKGKFKKGYASQAEESKRRANFESRAKQIAAHNDEYKKGLQTFTLDINDLADKTDAELKAILGTRAPSKPKALRDTHDQTLESREIRADCPSIDRKVDLRMHKCMPPIKDQGTCGSCWSFAAINLVEFANCLKKGLTSPVILSEQNLVDCTYTTDGCAGGFYTTAWSNANNTASNASYPYTSGKTGKWNGKCTFNPAKAEAKVSTYKYLKNEAGTELALNNWEPVAVAIQVVGSKFFYYKSGIYNDVVSCNASVIGTSINHAVTLVGYNNTNNPAYWILRNSWGATWGISGYMYFQKGINLCNVGLYPYGAVTLK